MRREFHVRFCEGPGVRSPRATRSVVLLSSRRDAERFLAVLPRRLGKFGLTLHPDKTRLVPFRRPDRVDRNDGGNPGTFNLLGFTHYWSLSRQGKWVVKRKTAKDRFSRALHRFREWCRWHRHDPVETQHRTIVKKLKGHYAYYGITSNASALERFLYEATRAWHKALARRSQRGLSWERMVRLLRRFPLPAPRVVHSYVT